MDKRKIADKIFIVVCDDIRHEVGNKISIMGIYDDVIVGNVPTILPKINLAIIFSGIKHRFKSIQITLKNPGGSAIDLPELKTPPSAKIGANYNMDICVAPLKIDKPGIFVWEIKFDGEKKPSIVHKMNIRTSNNPKPSKQK